MSCPACGSTLARWCGRLGALLHLNCRACGMTYSIDAPDFADDGEDFGPAEDFDGEED
jgi:hypothetical protein